MNQNPIPLSAALLAGGKSMRMGSDKAGLIFAGEPLWRRQLATLRAIKADELLISCGFGNTRFYSEQGIALVHDAIAGLGPLGGIAAVLERARFESVLFLAIDLPEIKADFLSVLIEAAIGTGKGIVPRDERWFQPLAAIYTRACLPLVKAHLQGPDRSMQYFIKSALNQGLVIEYAIKESERVFFKNLNTIADLS